MLPVGLLIRVVIPTIARKNTVIIGISSKPVSEDSPMNMMMKARFLDTGERIFRTKIFRRLCNACKARGNLHCKHKVEVQWSNQRQTRKIAGLMKQHEHEFRTEILNEEVETLTTRAFPKSVADPFLDSKYHMAPGSQIRQVFVGVDPSGGGTQSKFAIVSLVFVERQHAPQKQRRTLGLDGFVNPSHPSNPGRHDDTPIYDTVVPHITSLLFFT